MERSALRTPTPLSAEAMEELAALRQQWGDGFVDALLANYRPSGPNSFTPRVP